MCGETTYGLGLKMKIYIHILKKKSIFTNLINVAQERFFYKLAEFTEDEEIFLRLFVENISHKAVKVKELNLEFCKIFTYNGKIKQLSIQNESDLFKNKDLRDEE